MTERVLPLFILFLAGGYLFQALQLPFGSAARPGAGFYPVLVAVFACVVALVASLQAWRAPVAARAAPENADPDGPARRRRVTDTVGALAAFALVLPWVGYPAAAFVFVTFVLRRLGTGWLMAGALGVLAAAASYGLFAILLDVPLPRGFW
jgi:putative tricarboxylic transport membrane protein